MSELSRSGCQLEFPGFEHKRAMMVTKGKLSPEAALIAAQIPRIEPLLRMIEAHGFDVAGLNEEPEEKLEPIRLASTSPGIQAFHNRLNKGGFSVTRHTESPRKAVQG